MQFITNCLPADPFGHAMRLIVRQTWPKKKKRRKQNEIILNFGQFQRQCQWPLDAARFGMV